MRTNWIRRFGAGLALVGLLCQLVLSVLHVPGAMARESVSETGQLVTILCTPSGVKRIVIDLDGANVPINAPEDSEDVSLQCPACFSHASMAFALMPDVAGFAAPLLQRRKFVRQASLANIKASGFRASQRAPPLQA